MPGGGGESLERRLVTWDRQMGLLSLVMWGGTAIKTGPRLSVTEVAQAWVGELLMLLIPVLWPTLSYPSYVRWRTPALAFMRFALIAMPFQFSGRVFDAVSPGMATGRFAVLFNIYMVLNALRIITLFNISVGWRLPFRLHMALEAVGVGLLCCFGMHNFCRSKLLSSPEFQAVVQQLHGFMELLVTSLAPTAINIKPADPYLQQVAAQLFLWLTLGWLVPTLFLLPGHTEEAAQAGSAAARRGNRITSGDGSGSRGSGSGSGQVGRLVLRACTRLADRAGDLLEAWLRCLKGVRAPEAAQVQQEEWHERLPAVGVAALMWAATLALTWAACCAGALLYARPPSGSTS